MDILAKITIVCAVLFVVWALAPSFVKREKEPTSGTILNNGKVLWNGRMISMAEATRRDLNLKMAKPDKKKRHYWKAWD